VVLLVTMIGELVYHCPQLPERIPCHFNAAGQPDGWGPKSSAVAVPAIGHSFYCILTVLLWFPQR
jgi:uncharacterized membrane protein